MNEDNKCPTLEFSPNSHVGLWVGYDEKHAQQSANNLQQVISPNKFHYGQVEPQNTTQSTNRPHNQRFWPHSTPLHSTAPSNHHQVSQIRSINIDSSASNISSKSRNSGRGGRKRSMANERERERTKSLNHALAVLRNRLPVPEEEKRSKIQTLRMAKEYIEFLARFNQTNSTPQVVEQKLFTTVPIVDNDHLNNGPPCDSSPSRILPTNAGPTSPLTYKFFKFRLKSQSSNCSLSVSRMGKNND